MRRRIPQRSKRLVILAAAGSVAVLALVGAAQTQVDSPSAAPAAATAPAQVEEVLDHFKCYVSTFPHTVGLPVTLRDQFEPDARVEVLDSRFFCNPASKNDSSIRHPEAHLTCYGIQQLAVSPPRAVQTSDQFGTATLAVGSPLELCVPTVKGPDELFAAMPRDIGPAQVEEALDHFKCYVAAGGTISPRPVHVLDQFNRDGSTQVQVLPGPRLLCNPASKNDGPVRHPEAHLTCYDIIDEGGPGRGDIPTENQFGAFVLAGGSFGQGVRLCVPATKRELPPLLSHYKCYDTKAKPGKRDVVLSDQFGAEPAVVRQPRLLCNPVEKQIAGEVTPIADPEAHLQCYDVTEKAKGEHRVSVDNQFGTQTLTTGRAELLCLPSSKSRTDSPGAVPSDLDHFKCYRVKGEERFERSGVTLRDQFHTEDAVVLKPEQLCNPVEKRHGDVTVAIQFPELHLVCYGLKSKNFKGPVVSVRDQFGLERVDVHEPRMLCVPSAKTELDTGQPGG